MNSKEKEQFFEEFNNGLHRIGRIMLIIATVLLVSLPFIIGAINGVVPDIGGFFAGFINAGTIFVIMSIAEFLIYTPMLGVGGSYLSFLTGNVTNMKIPCAMNARTIAETEVGTPENEIVSTLSVATSAIVTTIVIAIGVVLCVPLEPILTSEVLSPAYDNVVPALFGALALQYFSKSPKIAIVPLVVMCLICIFIPSMITQSSTLMIPGGLLALAIAFVLFKKGKL